MDKPDLSRITSKVKDYISTLERKVENLGRELSQLQISQSEKSGHVIVEYMDTYFYYPEYTRVTYRINGNVRQEVMIYEPLDLWSKGNLCLTDNSVRGLIIKPVATNRIFIGLGGE